MPAVDSLPQLASFIFLILYSLLRFYHLRLLNSTHGQTDPLFVQIHADDFYIHNISYADNFHQFVHFFLLLPLLLAGTELAEDLIDQILTH